MSVVYGKERIITIMNQRDEKDSKELFFVLVDTEDQINKIAALATEIWHEHFITILTPEQIDYMVEQFQSVEAMKDQTKNQGYHYYMLMVENNLVGYCGVKEEDPEKALFLSKLYIHKDFRGKGYASLAFDYLVELCKKKGYQKIWLTVNRFNDHTIKVYEKKGFQKIRTQVKDIGNGYVMDDYIMEKEID